MTSPVCPQLRKWLSSWHVRFFAVLTIAMHSQTASLSAADYLINVWSSEDGLPQNSVNCLAQTPDGYLWVGTRSGGLARFDGERFVTFNPQTTPELKDVEIEALSVDSYGTLWITAGNESIASLTRGKFRLVREPNAEPRWHPLQIQIIAEDAGAVYLAAYDTAVYRIPRSGAVNEAQRIELSPPPPDPPTGQFIQARDGALWYVAGSHQVAQMRFIAPTNIGFSVFRSHVPATALTRDQAGEIWVAEGDRLGVMTRDGFADRTPTNGFAPSGVRQMIPARDGGLWIWDGNTLRKMARGQWTVGVPGFKPAPNRGPLHFLADAQGGLWVIQYGTGLWHVRPDGAATLLTLENGLPSRFVTCCLEDNEGNIWIGTKEAGLVRIRDRQFKEYTADDGIPGNVAQSVCEDAQGTMWVGTATGGLAHKEGGRFVSVPLATPSDPMIESVTVCPDATSGVWIGTLQGNAFRYVNNQVHSVNTGVSSFPLERLRDHEANAMMQDSQGRVWFCNGSGASYFQNGVFTAFDRSRGFVENIGVRAIAEGPPGTLWFGTEPGDVWQLSHATLKQYHPPNIWPNARVSALLPDSDGGVWVGTLGDGLLHLENGRFTRITAAQGLPDDSITELLDDQDGNLWGGTYKGIFRASKQDLKCLGAGDTNEIALSVFGHFDGLPAQAYSGWFQPSCWRSHDGRLWFTTVKGLVVVNPHDIVVNHRPPPVVIEEMQVDGDPCDFTAGVNDDKHVLRIAPGRHYIEFRFTGINFTEPDKVRFKWRLDGAERNWRESADQRIVGYGPLVPGDYRFSVLAANSDGIWNKTGASLAFIVLPFFWETWWFKTCLVGMACGGLALAVTIALHRRHRLVLERLERRHEMERERTRIAHDMHDEIGSKLARISYLSEVVKAEGKSVTPADGPIDSLSKTARDLLQSLDRMLWAVNPRNDSLERLSAYLNRYAAEYFQNTPIRCQLAFPENLPAVQLTAETRHNIFLAFQEALANALKHSAATKISAQLSCNNGTIEISITDNGCGFNVEARGEAAMTEENGHLGLSGMYHRLRSIGGECQIRSSPAEGTFIKFVLPLHQSHV
jgi:signal transduction histidine kinase/ligand-binding sensor domain-containing protein